MGWACGKCATQHTEAFEACWRCGQARSDESSPEVVPTGNDALEAESDDQLPVMSPEEEAYEREVLLAEREVLSARAADLQTQAVVDGDTGAYLGYSDGGTIAWFTRVRRGHACYRARQRHPEAPARRDLDWLWTAMHGGLGLCAGGAIVLTLPALQPASPDPVMYLMGGGVVFAMCMAQWAAGKEIEAARNGGWSPPG